MSVDPAAATISVVMPVHNTERYLAEAVESILGQTFRDFEFIIIDDGSTDGSRRILERFAAQDARVRVVSRPNAGLIPTLNEGLGLARGEFLARMDPDDVALPRRFEMQVDYLRGHPECIGLGTWALLIDADGRPIRPHNRLLTHEEIDEVHLKGEPGGMIHPTLMIRLEALAAIGGYRVELQTVEDCDMLLRLAERGRLANLPEILLKYRRHLQAAGYLRHQQELIDIRKVVRDARERRGLPELPEAPASPQAGRGWTVPETYRLWAWWALSAGNVATARRYALASLRSEPFTKESWLVAYCSLRGR